MKESSLGQIEFFAAKDQELSGEAVILSFWSEVRARDAIVPAERILV